MEILVFSNHNWGGGLGHGGKYKPRGGIAMVGWEPREGGGRGGMGGWVGGTALQVLGEAGQANCNRGFLRY